jgi:hypothetical protein
MNRTSIVSSLLLVVFTSPSLTGAYSLSPFQASITQQRERLILKKGDDKAPVKINGLRAKGQIVLPNKPFMEGEDWLKELSIELANTSDKTVSFVMIQVFFPHPDRSVKKPGAALFIEYGDNPFNYKSTEAMPPLRVKPILPGDLLELTLSNEKYDTIKPLLESAQITDNNTIEIRVAAIGFTDGTAWSGQMAQRNSQGAWMPLRDQNF